MKGRKQGSIRRRGKASWAVIIDLGPDPATGKRRQKWHSVRGTKRDAQRALTALLHDLDEGSYVEPTRTTVAELLDLWLGDVEARVRPKTLERYREIVDKHLAPALGHHTLRALQPMHISAAWAEALKSGRRHGQGGLSAQTVKHLHRVLSQALRQAERWRMIARNPAELVDAPRPQRRDMETLSVDHSRNLLKAIEGTRLHLPVMIALATGLRRGEVLGLTWGAIDLDKRQIFVTQTLEQTADGVRLQAPKTARSRRRVTVAPSVVAALREHKIKQAERALARGWRPDGRTLVICRDDGRPIKPGSLTKDFTRTLPRLGFPPLRFHDLRHTHASHLLLKNRHPKAVSERLGHASVSITLDTYSHVAPELHEAIADDAEALFGTGPERS